MRALMAGLGTAFSLYSVIPVPQIAWREENARYALCFFPLVGVPIGGLLLLWTWLCGAWVLSPLLFAAGAALLPVIVSGGIHMDGLMDTMDAVASHAEPERRLEILKDPHTGAFGVLGCVGYLLLSAGLWTQVYAGSWRLVCLAALGPVVARALDGLSIAVLPCARSSGLAFYFAGSASRGAAVAATVGFAVAGLAVAVWLDLLRGGVLAAVCVGAFLWHRRMCIRHFGGNTGDLAGYLLQKIELLFLVAAASGGIR